MPLDMAITLPTSPSPPSPTIPIMQRPTCVNLRIRNAEDANRVLHAVRNNILPMVKRRLDDQERLSLRSGCVYVWEERGNNPLEVTGQEIQRFTEGRCWGPSRARQAFISFIGFIRSRDSHALGWPILREDFLLYYEKEATNRSSILTRIGSFSEPMVKQTYSVYIDGVRGGPKWHLNAYYTHETQDHLRTVDDIPALRVLQVPQGLYIPARTTSTRARPKQQGAQRSSLDDQRPSLDGHPQHGSYSRPINNDPPRQLAIQPAPPSLSFQLRPILPAAARPVAEDHSRPQLAPLEYLENITPPKRHDIDDDYLRQFRHNHGI